MVRWAGDEWIRINGLNLKKNINQYLRNLIILKINLEILHNKY